MLCKMNTSKTNQTWEKLHQEVTNSYPKGESTFGLQLLCEFPVLKSFHGAVVTNPSNTVNNESDGFLHLG